MTKRNILFTVESWWNLSEGKRERIDTDMKPLEELHGENLIIKTTAFKLTIQAHGTDAITAISTLLVKYHIPYDRYETN